MTSSTFLEWDTRTMSRPDATVMLALTMLGTGLAAGGEPAPAAPPAATGLNPSKEELVKVFEARTFDDGAGRTMKYRLFVPKGYADTTIRYPLTVFLHGSGESGDDNASQLINNGPGALSHPSTQEKFPSFVLCPQCPKGGQWGYYRGDIAPADTMVAIVRALQKEFRIDPDRIYITGLSLGGMGTWYAIAEHPDLFAAAVPVCGAGDVSRVDRIKSIPVWAFHGTDDKAVPIAGPVRWSKDILGDRDVVRALKDAGGSARITEYEKQGHNVWVTAYTDPGLMPWLFAQVKRRATPGLENR
jgi:predicted peptidase